MRHRAIVRSINSGFHIVLCLLIMLLTGLLQGLSIMHRATFICESGINLPLLAAADKQGNWLSVNEFWTHPDVYSVCLFVFFSWSMC